MLAGFVSFLNKPIEPPLLKQGYHKHIEQYRGLCALLVLIDHGMSQEGILINNFNWPGFIHYLGAGHMSVLILHCNPGIVFLANYLNGYCFWLLVLFIGWKIFGGNAHENLTVRLLSMLFLHLCLHHLGLGLMILKILGIYTKTNFDWIFDIPFSLMIMCILTQKENSFLKYNKLQCYILPSIVFLYLILNHRIFEDIRWIMCLIFWLLSIIFYNEKRISAFVWKNLQALEKYLMPFTCFTSLLPC